LIIAKSNLARVETSAVDPHLVDADPDPDSSFQLKAHTLGKVLK
jgi:hypothetical protein